MATAVIPATIGSYLRQFEALPECLGEEPAYLRAAREHGLERFSRLGFPNHRDEEYKYSSLAHLGRQELTLAGHTEAKVPAEALEQVAFEAMAGPRMVFVNGSYRAELSDTVQVPEGVVFDRILNERAGLEGLLGALANVDNHALGAANTAFHTDGAVVLVPPRVRVEAPLQVVFVTAADAPDTMTHPRVVIQAGRESQVTVVESYVGLGAEPYWTNSVAEIRVGDNAQVDHIVLNEQQTTATHTGLIEARLGRDSRYRSHSICFGGSLVRNDIQARLEGEGGEATLNGLFAEKGKQHVDHHTVLDHKVPHCNSHQLYKGILDGKSTGVFNGKIIVRKDAQKTDAIQSNKNLLLSRNADINTKPQLEIDANDVRCTHGATVGQIDADAEYYLRARGIGKEQARSMLTYAFAADMLEQIEVPSIREHYEQRLLGWLGTEL